MPGYSGTPLVKKLGIKADIMLCVLNPPENYFDWISPLPEDVVVKEKLAGEFDFIHLFAKDKRPLRFFSPRPKSILGKMACYGSHGQRSQQKFVRILMKM